MPIKLKTVLPSLAIELHQLLVAAGENDLSEQVDNLQLFDRCGCGDDFCASFYTQPKPQGGYPPGYETIDLDAEKGMILVDIVKGSIAHVEILNRDDIRDELRALVL